VSEITTVKNLIEDLEVFPVTIDLPFRLNHVNCFIAKGIDGWVIIDTGLHNKTCEENWKSVVENRDITDIVITHSHQDHYGYAGEMQRKTGARVLTSRKTADNAQVFWAKEWFDRMREQFVLSGIPSEYIDKLVTQAQDSIPLVTPHPICNRFLNENDRIVFGKYEYEVILTSGHSEGMICLYNKERNVLFSADHVLPKITPNISYRFHGDQNPLDSFFRSLKKVKKLDLEWVIPSHGNPFYNCNARIDEILKHHEERLEKIMKFIRTGATPYEVSLKLFQRRLTIHESRAAIGETIAHLEYLYLKGECKKETRANSWVYTL
jgi:glyoxylase-like metal-dependent hydrolase (beta-lactamase superfamily II)